MACTSGWINSAVPGQGVFRWGHSGVTGQSENTTRWRGGHFEQILPTLPNAVGNYYPSGEPDNASYANYFGVVEAPRTRGGDIAHLFTEISNAHQLFSPIGWALARSLITVRGGYGINIFGGFYHQSPCEVIVTGLSGTPQVESVTFWDTNQSPAVQVGTGRIGGHITDGSAMVDPSGLWINVYAISNVMPTVTEIRGVTSGFTATVTTINPITGFEGLNSLNDPSPHDTQQCNVSGLTVETGGAYARSLRIADGTDGCNFKIQNNVAGALQLDGDSELYNYIDISGRDKRFGVNRRYQGVVEVPYGSTKDNKLAAIEETPSKTRSKLAQRRKRYRSRKPRSGAFHLKISPTLCKRFCLAQYLIRYRPESNHRPTRLTVKRTTYHRLKSCLGLTQRSVSGLALK